LAAVLSSDVRVEIPELPLFGFKQNSISNMSEIEVHRSERNVDIQSTPIFSAGNKGIHAIIDGSSF
jgi:hypothetical protein